MNEFLINFHFLRPWWLVLALIPIIGFVYSFKKKGLQSSWQKIVDPRLLDFLLVRGSFGQRRLLSWIVLVGMLSAVIAAAGPSWKKIELPALESKKPTMIVLNLSSDMKNKDIQPSRLERAKYKIKDLLQLLKGSQVGLEVYSAEPFVISPLTEDTNILVNLLPAINYDIMPVNGDRLDRAIQLAVQRMQSAQYQNGEIIVFAPDIGQKFEQSIAAAKEALVKGYKTNIIGVTTNPSEKLEMVANAGGGIYAKLQSNDSDINLLAQKIINQKSELAEGRNWQSIWLDYGYYLLILPLLCCLYFFRKGILVIAWLCVCGDYAEASFFFNANQDGLRAFNQENYQAAANSFDDSKWKGASFYRLGEYDKALNEFVKYNDKTAIYNQGNALAKSGKVDEAIAKYEEVLKNNPEHEDAKFNLEYLKKQKNKQNQNKEQQNEQQSQQQGQESENNQDQQAQNKNNNNNSEQQEQKNSEKEQSDENKNNSNSDQQEQNDVDNDKSAQTNQQSPQELDASLQNKNSEQQGGAIQQQGQDDKQEYDEKTQARAQQLREIPEDAGGLLRAFIRQEYFRNRYNDRQE